MMVKLSPKILAHQEKATTTISSPEDVVESVLYTSSPPPLSSSPVGADSSGCKWHILCTCLPLVQWIPMGQSV